MTRIEFSAAFFAFFSLTVLLACSVPDTTKNTLMAYSAANAALDYPRESFLRAEGLGASAREAGENARLNLARIFAVRIVGEQQSFRQLSSMRADDKETVELSYSMNNRVKQQTDQLIEGSEIIAGYDELTKTHRALAILEKSPASARLKQQIARLDQQTRSSLEQTSTDDQLDALAHAYQAWQLQLLADRRRQQLTIIESKAVSESPWPTYLLRQQVVSRLTQISFHTITRNLDNDWRQMVFSALAKTGLEHLEDDDADYQLTITANMAQPFQSDYWYWQTASLGFYLSNKTDNRERGGWIWNLKTSATTESLIAGRMKKTMQKRIEQDTLTELLKLARKSLPADN